MRFTDIQNSNMYINTNKDTQKHIVQQPCIQKSQVLIITIIIHMHNAEMHTDTDYNNHAHTAHKYGLKT